MAPRALKEKAAAPIIAGMKEFIVRPDPDDPRLTRRVAGIDQEGKPIETAVVTERPLTLFLNGREIVTMMTIGDHPDYLAVGYLLNQNMLGPEDRVMGVDYDEEIETVVVRTDRETDFEDKLKKKMLTSRSGFTAWGVELARQAGLTLIGRARGKRFVALAGEERIVFDSDPRAIGDEPARLARKASLADEVAADGEGG